MSAWMRKQIIRNLACPQPGFMGWVTSVITRRESKLLERNAAKLCDIKPDHHVLELGFGQGYGLQAAYQYIKDGSGKVYGVDISQRRYFEAIKHFKKQAEENKIDITFANVYHLPFRTGIFDKVFHSDCYYFWYYMDLALEEIHRVMKPGSIMVSTMCMDTLKKSASRGLLRYEACNPMYYMNSLQQFGFDSVHIEYHKEGGKTFESITARKPVLVE